MTMAVLGELVGKSASAISHYENARHVPTMDVLVEIAQALRVPPEFFFAPPRPPTEGPTFFRSMSAATERSRRRADRRVDWAWDLLRFVDDRIELPTVAVPPAPQIHWEALTREDIELRASALRQHWELGSGPLSNVVWLAEEAGFVLVRDKIGNSKLDAHHRWCSGRPVIVLNTDKESAVRSRFDCAHEIGHADMHRGVPKEDLRSGDLLKRVEKQANWFAAAFLLPAETFAQELGSVTLDGLLQMKLRWRVSVAALIQRCVTLDIIGQKTAQRLWKGRSARGWTKREPLDDEIFPEQPRLLASAITLSLSHGLASRQSLIAETGLPRGDIEKLAGLGNGFLDDEPTRVYNIGPRLHTS